MGSVSVGIRRQEPSETPPRSSGIDCFSLFFMRQYDAAKCQMPDFIQLQQLADDAMRRGDFLSGNDYYCAAWDDYSEKRKAASVAGIVKEFDKTNTSSKRSGCCSAGLMLNFAVGTSKAASTPA